MDEELKTCQEDHWAEGKSLYVNA